MSNYPKPKRGRPCQLTEETKSIILDSLKKNLPYEMVAWRSMISKTVLNDWLVKGREDKANGIDSVYRQFADDFLRTEAEKVAEHLTYVETTKKSWTGRLKILEKRWYRHFGANAGLYNDLVDTAKNLLEKMNSIKSIGVAEHGGEMDSEGNQKKGQLEEGTWD